MEPTTTSRRSRTNAARTQALMNAAAEAFAERGFEAATMDDVAARAGLTKGALYHRFASKDDLFLALLDERCAAYLDQFARELAPDARMRDPREVAPRLARALQGPWPRLFTEFVAYAHGRPERRDALRSRMAGLRDALASGIEGGARDAGLTLPVAPRVLAMGILVTATGWSVERLADPRGVDEDLLEQLLGLLFAGVAATAR